ncbi:YbaB/EbfC family nucleoid-associated protein [Chloroflexi bacterium]|nr:nucleoid-associated protein, YbaB/EbfC family [Chloroflexota bacterium]MDC0253095.1 YbaB/EbfC family nucleoid-associated protein [Chloroflexota bacterium]RZP13423.1 MAG: YbaB/EbfC family nucleoid-associated protein [Chloroflexota bacterium]|tara:strand:- start:22967 stop:23272 length:306 start_codon:yes stop_codon:yes gene_type:complete
MFNMDKLKQAGSLMKKMNGLKKKIDKLETIAESKDGNIRVVVQGTSNIKSIKIDEDFLPQVSAKDLEKNLIKALNEAMKEAEKSSKKIMSEVTGGLNIPGL